MPTRTEAERKERYLAGLNLSSSASRFTFLNIVNEFSHFNSGEGYSSPEVCPLPFSSFLALCVPVICKEREGVAVRRVSSPADVVSDAIRVSAILALSSVGRAVSSFLTGRWFESSRANIFGMGGPARKDGLAEFNTHASILAVWFNGRARAAVKNRTRVAGSTPATAKNFFAFLYVRFMDILSRLSDTPTLTPIHKFYNGNISGTRFCNNRLETPNFLGVTPIGEGA